MSELSRERREELADALGVAAGRELAVIVAPLIAGWLADARAEALRDAATWAAQAGWPMNTAAPVLRIHAELDADS